MKTMVAANIAAIPLLRCQETEMTSNQLRVCYTTNVDLFFCHHSWPLEKSSTSSGSCGTWLFKMFGKKQRLLQNFQTFFTVCTLRKPYPKFLNGRESGVAVAPALSSLSSTKTFMNTWIAVRVCLAGALMTLNQKCYCAKSCENHQTSKQLRSYTVSHPTDFQSVFHEGPQFGSMSHASHRRLQTYSLASANGFAVAWQLPEFNSW